MPHGHHHSFSPSPSPSFVCPNTTLPAPIDISQETARCPIVPTYYSLQLFLMSYYLQILIFIFYAIFFGRIWILFIKTNRLMMLSVFFNVSFLIFGSIYNTLAVVYLDDSLDIEFFSNTWRLNWIEFFCETSRLLLVLASTNSILRATHKLSPVNTNLELWIYTVYSFISILVYISLNIIQIYTLPKNELSPLTVIYFGIEEGAVGFLGIITVIRMIFVHKSSLSSNEGFILLIKNQLLLYLCTIMICGFTLMDGFTFNEATNNFTYTYFKPIARYMVVVRVAEQVYYCETIFARPRNFLVNFKSKSSSSFGTESSKI